MTAANQPYFLQALDALRHGDRRSAALLLGRELREGSTSKRNLPHVRQLAAHIGEVDLAIEAARLGVEPGVIETHAAYWAVLANYGRSGDAANDLQRLPASMQDHPVALHFLGTMANEQGSFDEAERLFRRALSKAPGAVATWFSLSMLKTFVPGDADIAAMEKLTSARFEQPELSACLNYALGKAYDDCSEIDRAFGLYAQGAAIRRAQAPMDLSGLRRAADQARREFTSAGLQRLAPSTHGDTRSLFVTGLPRSGTTLTEQILLGHSLVQSGGELNLLGSALLPARGSLAGALDYQQRSTSSDPWGDVARDYDGLVDRFFRSSGLRIDKSLGQTMLTGLALHAMPEARIAWLRRDPEDVALSCFRTYFTEGLQWTWSLQDIADYMRIEDQLFEHWVDLFGERILVVPYEQMVADPSDWAIRLQKHFCLPVEPGIELALRDGRSVRTASVGQARETVTTARIGTAKAYEQHLKPFRDRYYGGA